MCDHIWEHIKTHQHGDLSAMGTRKYSIEGRCVLCGAEYPGYEGYTVSYPIHGRYIIVPLGDPEPDHSLIPWKGQAKIEGC